MKKLVILTSILILLMLPLNTIAQTGPDAEIEVDSRVVEVMKLGTRQWLGPNNFTDISTADRLRTREEGVVTIMWFDEGSQLRLIPETEIVVEEFSGTERAFTISASLLYGTIFNYVPEELEEESVYQIWTPFYLVSTAGESVFAVSVDDEQNTTIAVRNGTVQLSAYETPDTVVEIEAEMLVTIDDAGELDDPVDLEDADNDFEEMLDALAEFGDERIPSDSDPEADEAELDEDDATDEPEDDEESTPEAEETAEPDDENEVTTTPDAEGETPTPED